MYLCRLGGKQSRIYTGTEVKGSGGQKVRGSGVRTLTIAGLRLLAFRVGEGELVSVPTHPHRCTAGRVERGPRAAHGAVTAARGSEKINRGKQGGKIKTKCVRTEE